MSSSHLILFDIYTLVPNENNNLDLFEAVERIENIIRSLIELSKKKFSIGVVSEYNIDSIYEHLSDDIINKCDYIFSENGIRTYENNFLIHKESIVDYLGKEVLTEIIYNTNDMINNSWVSFINQKIIIKTGQIEIHFEISDTNDKHNELFDHQETLLLRLKISLDKHNVKCFIDNNTIIIRPINWDSNYYFSVIDNHLEYDKITVFRNNSLVNLNLNLSLDIDKILVKNNDNLGDIIRKKFLQA